MRVYISGPITNNPNYISMFHQAEKELSYIGYKAVNPVKISERLGPDATHETYMKKDIEALLSCDAIMFLPGWEESEGCRLEKEVAGGCGIPTIKIKVQASRW